MLIDTHAHLNFEAFKNDFEMVIKRAQSSGVAGIINVGSNLETSRRALEIAQKFPGVFAAVGLHPIHVKDEQFDENAFLKLAQNPKVVAIGETGLDYYHDKSAAELQKEIFQKHINIASQVGKPLIVHSREANDDIVSLLIAQDLSLRGVFHCFPGDLPMAKLVLDLGFYLSFTGLITFSKNYANLQVAEEVPLEKIMVETDCPYLTPEPHRGQRNEPAYVVEVASKIAEIKKISLVEVTDQTTKNAVNLFKLDL